MEDNIDAPTFFDIPCNVLYTRGTAAPVLERGGRLALEMTPAETCVLFSAHVLAFAFIWFTGIAEGGDAARPCKPAEGGCASYPEIRDRLEKSGHQHEMIWNVAGFFGLGQK